MLNLSLNIDRTIHSIKTALACLIGFIITKSTHLPVDQWLIITIIVVMCAQINVGSMIQKSSMRFFGTLSGSIVATTTLLLLGTDTFTIGIVITLSAMLFSYIATGQSNISEAGTLGAVTVTIILISQHPTLTTAIGRFLEISFGILIAALVSQFILPIHARNLLHRKQIQALRLLRSYYLATFLTKENSQEMIEYHIIDEQITNLNLSQRKLIKDALQEPFAKKTTLVSQFYNMLWCEREMQRAITFMHHAYKSSPESKKIFSSQTVLDGFHNKICEAFETIASHVEKKTLKQIHVDIPTLQAVENAITAEKSKLTSQDLVYTNAFLFCAEILTQRMHELITFIRQ